MLRIATLGMTGYGLYSAITGLGALFGAGTFRLWISLGLIFFGGLLVVAALLVRVVLPGSLQLAIGALLGLQALALSHTFHLREDPSVIVQAQIARALLAAVLVGLAWAGSRGRQPLDEAAPDEGPGRGS